MHYEQFYVKYKGLNREYINNDFMSFSDLELSFWFELRYSKTGFRKMYLKGSSFVFVKCYRNSHVTRFPWKPRVILARFVDFDVTPTNL